MQQSPANTPAASVLNLIDNFDWLRADDASVVVRLDRMLDVLATRPVTEALIRYQPTNDGIQPKDKTVADFVAELTDMRWRHAKRLLDNLGGRVADQRRALMIAEAQAESESTTH